MTLPAFLSAILALLLAPGPTNALMALGAAAGGWQRALRLTAAALLGYVSTVLPLAVLGTQLHQHWPTAATTLTVLSSIWVMFLAVRLWTAPSRNGGSGEVTTTKVYLTTVMNPKALSVGLVLLPAPDSPAFPLKLGLFLAIVVVAGLVWNGAGALARMGSDGTARLRTIQRAASVWLAIVSVTLIAGAVRA